MKKKMLHTVLVLLVSALSGLLMSGCTQKSPEDSLNSSPVTEQSVQVSTANETAIDGISEIESIELKSMMDAGENPVIVDVRPGSSNYTTIKGALRIPVDEIASRIYEIPSGVSVIIAANCH